ncbi:hypothetical protein KP3161_28745, partial (plasmid) [Klebsiella pneumoniae]
ALSLPLFLAARHFSLASLSFSEKGQGV